MSSTRPFHPARRATDFATGPGRIAVALLALGLLLATATASFAEETGPEYDRPGGYFFGSVAGAIEDFKDASGSTDSVLGATVGWGYRAGPSFGIELSYTWLDELDKKENKSDRVHTVISESVDIWLLMGHAKYVYPLGRFQPNLRGGLGFMQANFHGQGVDREVGLTTSIGLGSDVYITENFALALNADYILPVGDSVSDLRMGLFTGGLKYRF